MQPFLRALLRPAHSAAVSVVLGLIFALLLPVRVSSQTILNESARLIAGDAATGDFAGHAVAISASGTTIAVGAPGRDASTGVQDAGAVYVYVRDATTGAWSQQAKLTATGGAAGDMFGYSVAVSDDGNTVVAGAPSGAGQVYVFERTGSTWNETQRLSFYGVQAGDRFGTSVAMRGGTIAVGAPHGGTIILPGTVFVFRRSGATWVPVAQLLPSDGRLGDDFGSSVAIDEDESTIVVGAPGESEPDNACSTSNYNYGCRRGAAYVFLFDKLSEEWRQQGKLTAPMPGVSRGGDEFGSSVAISGGDIVVGAPGDQTVSSVGGGAAYLFHRLGIWVQSAELSASDAEGFDRFGASVAIYAKQVLIGAPRNDDACPAGTFGGCDSGSAYLFDYNGSWVERAKLLASDARLGHNFGGAVSLVGSNAAVGAPSRGSNLVGSEGTGRAYAFAMGVAPDLTVTAVANPPATAAFGDTFSVAHTVANVGIAPATVSITRFYLSLDATKDAQDTLLIGGYRTPPLTPGTTAGGSAQLTVPTMPLGTYFLLACADDIRLVTESDEANNCRAAATKVQVNGPDLVETALSNPPATAVVGATLSVTDTVKNQGTAPASGSWTRYFLSLNTVKDLPDVSLGWDRPIAGLAPGATSSGTMSGLRVPSIAAGTYYLLACADARYMVREGNEMNNCRAAATPVRVTGPDLVEASLSNPPATAAPGSTFSVTDTVRNGGTSAAAASTTRYYLSLNATRDYADRMLTGGRSVPSLAIGAVSSGTTTIQIPATVPSNTYLLLACSDDQHAVPETNEANNCRASSTTVTVQ